MQELSDDIRKFRRGVAGNPYQGKDKKVLFVCSMGILRSATGARLYARKYNTRSAGTYADALIQVTPLLLNWADEIVFVNRDNFESVSAVKSYVAEMAGKSVKVLDIPDQYEHMHPALIDAFEQQYEAL